MNRQWSILAAWIILVAAITVVSFEVQNNAQRTRAVVCGTLLAQVRVTIDANSNTLEPAALATLQAEMNELWRQSGCEGQVPEWFAN